MKMNIFAKGLNILIKTFCVRANGFKALSLPYKLGNFLFAALKLLAYPEKTYLKVLSNGMGGGV
jgi:hypothetical protein